MSKFNNYYKISIAILIAVVLVQFGIIVSLSGKKHTSAVVSRKEAKPLPRIAIVIDDWGYNLNNAPIIRSFKYPITASILPNLPYSKTVAEELHKLGFETILHLPMEPLEKTPLENKTILTTMDERQITSIIDEDLVNFPFIKGVSNHMGSKATEDSKTMEFICKELKHKNLYFLDSLVSTRSNARAIAQEHGLAFAQRDIFLDNQNEYGSIKLQLVKLVNKAKLYGQAIGIGHDRKLTLEVLREAMPQIAKEGCEFVKLSDLVH